jgi:ABC-2 type transport system ATP-binding protein
MLGIGAASLLMLLGGACSTALARDAIVTSFDGTPIVTHFYPAVGLTAGQRAPTVLIGPGYANAGDTNPTRTLATASAA